MITIVDLQTSLLDLLHEMEGSEVKVIIGGGFGIYLKVVHVAKEGRRTLWREWPEPRSTNDLDLFLRPELLIESEKLKPLAEAIERLGYQAVAGAEKYQFVKPGAKGADPGSVKIDILTGPQSRFKGTKVRADARRACPHPSLGTIYKNGYLSLKDSARFLFAGGRMAKIGLLAAPAFSYPPGSAEENFGGIGSRC